MFKDRLCEGTRRKWGGLWFQNEVLFLWKTFVSSQFARDRVYLFGLVNKFTILHAVSIPQTMCHFSVQVAYFNLSWVRTSDCGWSTHFLLLWKKADVRKTACLKERDLTPIASTTSFLYRNSLHVLLFAVQPLHVQLHGKCGLSRSSVQYVSFKTTVFILCDFCYLFLSTNHNVQYCSAFVATFFNIGFWWHFLNTCFSYESEALGFCSSLCS